MDFEVSDEITAYLEASGKIFLNACPGSGKTTTIAYKLARMIQNWADDYTSHQGVACLSFTNVAKNEINQKFTEFTGRVLQYPHLVSTIDSFVNQSIVLPFFHLFIEKDVRPTIVENKNVINDGWKRFYWNLPAREKTTLTRNNKPLHFSYPPYDISIQFDNEFTFRGKLPNFEKISPDLFKTYAQTVKKWQIRKAHILTNEDSIYIANHLLDKYPRIAKWIATRYPIIIVDEAQDTSETQLAFLEKLANAGVKSLELVGDPYQCVYEWRNAQPQKLTSKIQQDSTWQELDLSAGRRSHSKIIQCYSILRLASDKTIKNLSKIVLEHPVHILLYSEGNEDHAVEKYLDISNEYSERQIVVRGRSLRNKLMGNERPNKIPWKDTEIPQTMIYIEKAFQRQEFKKALADFRSLAVNLAYSSKTWEEKRLIIDVLKDDFDANSQLFEALRNLPSLDERVDTWTPLLKTYLDKIFSNLFHFQVNCPEFALKSRGYKTILASSITDLFGDQLTPTVPISTVHQVKGMTLDSLLLILNWKGHKENLNLKDITTPTSFPSEKQRLLYVAMSRPRHLLALGVPDKFSMTEMKQYLGEDVVIV